MQTDKPKRRQKRKHTLHVPHYVPVVQLDLDTGEKLKEYPSLQAAAAAAGVDYRRIQDACKGRRDETAGFAWSYKDPNHGKIKGDENSLLGEVWKPCPDDDKILVSNLGRFRNLRFGREVELFDYGGGYWGVSVCGKADYAHVIVAKTFIANPDPGNKTQVNHINHNRKDCRVENLEWVSPEGNARHGQGKAILQFDLEGRFIKAWSTMKGAEEELNISASLISAAVIGKRHSTGGFQFRYASEFSAHESPELKIAALAPEQKRVRAVNQYTKDGIFVKKWPSMSDAAKELEVSVTSIYRNCSRQLSSSGNKWTFRYCEDDELLAKQNPDKKPTLKVAAFSKGIKRPVNQYTANGKFVKTWPSQAEAAKALELNPICISRTCMHTIEVTGKKWTFRYCDDDDLAEEQDSDSDSDNDSDNDSDADEVD